MGIFPVAAAAAPGGPPAVAVPSLRRRCLHVVASALLPHSLWAEAEKAALQAGVLGLPAELQLELVQLLASWQQLDPPTCQLLSTACSSAGSSVLAGASTVSLAGCSLVDGASLHRQLLCCPLPQLQSLSLKGVLWLADGDVAQVLHSCPNLRRLDLSKCPRLTAAAVGAVATSPVAPQLQALSLAGCWQVDDLPGLRHCSQLTSLNLSGCWQLPEVAVRQVLGATPLLEELSLSGCTQLGNGLLVSKSGPLQTQQQQAAAGGGAAVAVGAAAEHAGRGGGRGAEVDDDENGSEEEGGEVALRIPFAGVSLPLLRCLDISHTSSGDCLMYWLAQTGCCRLQKLAISGTRVSGFGLSVLLAAKRALLHHHCCPGRQQQQQQRWLPFTNSSASQAPEPQLGVLPLLELAAGGTPAFGPSALQLPLPRAALRVAQQSWEDAQGGGLLLPLSSGHQGSLQHGPCLRLHLTEQPPDVTCPFCSSRPAPSTCQEVGGPLGGPQGDQQAPGWPPESQAELLGTLGPANLAQLQALDISGSGGLTDVALLIADGCRGLQRLRLAGCRTLRDASMQRILLSLPLLRELDVSGCIGSRTSRPGSRFLRHKAPRMQEGGLSDDSLCLLRPPEPSQQAANATAAKGAAGAGALAAAATATVAATVAATTAAAAAAAAPSGSCLLSLNASGLSITDATLGSLPSTLTSLQLHGCKRLNDGGLLQLLAQCPAVARLDVGGCSQLSADGFGCYFPFGGGQQAQQAQLAQQGARQGAQQAQQAQQDAQHGQRGQQEGEQLRGLKQGKPSSSDGGGGGKGLCEQQLTVSVDIPSRPSMDSSRQSRHSSSYEQGTATQNHDGAVKYVPLAPIGSCRPAEQPPAGRHSRPSTGSSMQSRHSSSHQQGTQGVAFVSIEVAGIFSRRPGEQQSHRQQQLFRSAEQQAHQQLQLFRRAVSTAAGVQLQRAALPRQACTREVLAWLSGQARASGSSDGSSGGSSSGGGRSTRNSGGSSYPTGFSHLQRLDLASCSLLTEPDLLALAACCPQLTSLQLGAAVVTAGSRLCAMLAQRCRLLSTLSISACASLADADLALLLSTLPNLQQMELTGCTSITGSVFKDWCQQLQSQSGQQQQRGAEVGIAISGSAGNSEAAGTAWRSECLLRTLRLDGCSLDDTAAQALAIISPHLQVLSLRQCKLLTGRGAAAVLCYCRALRELLLGGSGVRDCCSDAQLSSLWAGAMAAVGSDSAGSDAGVQDGQPQHQQQSQQAQHAQRQHFQQQQAYNLAVTRASGSAQPFGSRPSVLSLLELHPQAARHSPRWQHLLDRLSPDSVGLIFASN